MAGIADALIAYAPHPHEPRSVFIVGADGYRTQPAQVHDLLEAADRHWANCAVGVTRLIPLRETEIDDAAGVVVLGNWSPLGGFCQAVARVEEGPTGRLQILLLRRQTKGVLHAAERDWIEAAMPLFVESVLAFCCRKRAEQRLAVINALFDQMTTPTMVVDVAARPLTINRAARRLLARREGLRQTAEGVVAACNMREDRALRAAILDAAMAAEGEATAMQAIRLTDADGHWRLVVVMPARFCTEQGVARAATIVVPRSAVNAAPACILSALGLLPSEQRFLEVFLNSSSLSETAERANLSSETARTYLKRVRAKLGAHRQMDLARLVHGLIPPVAPTLADAE